MGSAAKTFFVGKICCHWRPVRANLRPAWPVYRSWRWAVVRHQLKISLGKLPHRAERHGIMNLDRYQQEWKECHLFKGKFWCFVQEFSCYKEGTGNLGKL
jgi:hypothetical protein